MAVDIGFNFRASSAYVTDGPEGVPVLNETFPYTYTNGNGDSVNGGWDATTEGGIDQAAGNDPRIAGCNYKSNGYGVRTFKVDLSSGSAPGAGNYTVDCAVGAANYATKADFQVKDTNTVLIDGTNGGSRYATATNHYIDATLADVTATTSWTGATSSQTFATTLAQMAICVSSGADLYTMLAHFRLTQQEGGGPETPMRRVIVRGA